MTTTTLMRRPMAHLAAAWRGLWSGPLTSSSPELAKLWATTPTSTGIGVSEQSALNYSAFWACVNAISTDVASLPLIHYKRESGGGKTRYTDSRLYRILHDEPNPEMTALTFRQTVTAHALTWGGGYAEIERDVQNRPLYLWPLTPNRVEPFRDMADEIQYRIDGGPVVIPARDMLHIPGLGFDGLTGYSVVAKARESIGLGIATERFGGTFFGQGSTFGGVMQHPGKMSEQAQKNWREWMNSQHQGVERAHKFLIAEEGMTYARMGIPPNDAQFLETRLHQVEEMCRWFRMPPHKIQHLLRATNNNIEHQGIEYYTDTMRPWLVRWEQEINRKLIAPVERRIQFCEHLIDGVLRGDLQSRYAAYAIGRQWGWLSADDICDRENMNPLPGGIGKVYLLPLNMTPADRISEIIDAQIAAKTAPPAPPADNGAVHKNALEMVDAIRVALTETQQKAEAHLARAIIAETNAERATEGGEALRAEAQRERTAAETACAETMTLRALLVEATERATRDLAERDAITEQLDATRIAGAHACEVLVLEVATCVAERDEARAKLTAAVLERERLDAELAARDVCVPEDETRLRELADLTAKVGTLHGMVEESEGYLTVARAALEGAETRAAAEALARTEADTALTTQRDSEQKRLVAVIGAHRSLIVDAMGRMIRRETEKARRAQATPEKLRAWIASFYPVHDEICRAALLPAIRAHVAWTQSGDDPAAVASGFVRQHIEESIRQLLAVLDSDPEDYAETLETTLRRWELERSDVLADVILQEAVGHVGQR